MINKLSVFTSLLIGESHMTSYLLLMRHAKHEAGPNDRAGGRKLSTDGENETKDVIEKLADMLREFRSDMDLSFNIKEIWRADTSEVIQTTDVVHAILKEPSIKNVTGLNPASFNPYKNTKKHSQVAECFREWASNPTENKAILVIGHQPFLSWLAHAFTGKALPLAHSEVASLAFDQVGKKPRGRLRWALMPSTGAARIKLEEDLKELKEKIKSKMEIAKLLGAVITTVLAFLLGYLVLQREMYRRLSNLRSFRSSEH
jgi:phosphohistidine phosphatase SixA